MNKLKGVLEALTKEDSTVLRFISPLLVVTSFSLYSTDPEVLIDLDEEDYQCTDKLVKMLTEDDLAEYVDDDLEGIVKSIKLGLTEDKYSVVATVILTRSPDDTIVRKIKEYLTGQYSDGIGESIEQRSLGTIEIDDSSETDQSDIYAHLWWSGNTLGKVFSIRLL